jgi:hypothetical protein
MVPPTPSWLFIADTLIITTISMTWFSSTIVLPLYAFLNMAS